MPLRQSPPLLRHKLVAAAWALLAAGSAARAADASPALSLLPASDRGLRADVAWLVDRGVLALPLGTWPLPSATLRAAWAGIDAGHLAPADADALARVQRAVSRSTETARMRAGVDSARHPSLDGNDTARGIAAGALAFYAGNEHVGGQLVLGTTAQNLTPDGPHGSLDGSYVVARFDNAVVAFGAVDRWWGPGNFTSPIMSNTATPITSALLRRVEDDAPESPLLNWIGRWGVAFRDALLGRSNIDDPAQKYEDPSDEIAGFDLRVSANDPWGGALVASLHLVGEDEAAKLPTKLFGTFGLQRKAVVGAQRLEVTVEATDTMPSHLFGLGTATPPPAYQHSVYHQGYYQGQLPIGAAIGGGGVLYSLGLAWTRIDDPQQLRVNATAFGGRMSTMGDQPRNAVYGTPGKLVGLALGVDGEMPSGLRWQLGASVQHYPEGSRPTLGLLAGVELPIDR